MTFSLYFTTKTISFFWNYLVSKYWENRIASKKQDGFRGSRVAKVTDLKMLLAVFLVFEKKKHFKVLTSDLNFVIDRLEERDS